jgi:hypothetical protein
MSCDLYFWRQSNGVSVNPQAAIDLLGEDRLIQGFTTFPRELLRAGLKEHFPDITDEDFQLYWDGEAGSFQVAFSHADEKHVHLIIVSCSHNLLESPETMNRTIDLFAGFGCALYDPQTEQRYDQPDEIKIG